jgi:hypothetical protein
MTFRMIEMKIDNTIIDDAQRKLQSNKIINESRESKFGSDESRILIGYIGERLVMNYLGIEIDSDDYNYDLMSNKGKRLEVKTVSCKFKPKDNYLCAVNSHDPDTVHKQKADYYIFVRVLFDLSIGWILGYIPCDEFFEKGKYIEKGTDFGKFKFIKANATVIEINQLNRFN